MNKNQNLQIAISFVVGLIVGVGGYWLVARHAPSTDQNAYLSSNENATTSEQMVMMQGDNGLVVNDQTAGNSVVVSQVVLKSPGWVAIHDDVNGEPGRILGAKLFDVGTSSGTVTLLRNTIAGTKYFAVIHSDDGNYKVFSPKTDKILMNGNSIVEVNFTATSDSSATPASSSSASSSVDTLLNL